MENRNENMDSEWTNRISKLLKEDKYQEALETADEALKILPGYATVWVMKARAKSAYELDPDVVHSLKKLKDELKEDTEISHMHGHDIPTRKKEMTPDGARKRIIWSWIFYPENRPILLKRNRLL